ncbi:MAG: amidohydrolase family protein [Erythrobacter sp.]
MIIDAHHHLWDLSKVNYPWLNARGVERFFGDPTPIQRDYDVADFRKDWAGLPIAGSVHIQVGAAPEQSVRETCWLNSRALETGFPSAIVAYVDLSSDIAMGVVDEHVAASARMRGIRHIVSRHPSEDNPGEGPALLDNPIFRENLKQLGARGLSFDLQCTPPHLHRAAELSAAIPALPVALCHAGSPWSQDVEGLAGWRSGLEALAQVPSVTCKLSGLGMFDRQWSLKSLRAVAETVMDVFGSQRVMWGSNFPVDRLYHGYSDMFSALRTIIPTKMHRDVFFNTAHKFYRLRLGTEAR